MVPDVSNPLPGVPLVESPFFRRFFDESHCDPETVRIAHDLNARGYATLDFPDAELGDRIGRIQSNLGNRYDWDSWRTRRVKSLRIQDAWRFDADVRAVATHPRILELLSRLYGRRAFAFQTLNFPVGTQQALHSDSYHFSSHPERFMCGVWVAFEDVDLENGPLMFAPGSHSWPVYHNDQLGVSPTPRNGHYPAVVQRWAALVEESGIELQRFTARQGQAIIWAANLLHGGDRQHDRERTRWSQVTHYYFQDCCYYAPVKTDPFMGRILFRECRDISTNQLAPHVVLGERVPISRRVPHPLQEDGAAKKGEPPDEER